MQQLVDEIAANTVDFLKIGVVKPSSIETLPVQHFIVNSIF